MYLRGLQLDLGARLAMSPWRLVLAHKVVTWLCWWATRQQESEALWTLLVAVALSVAAPWVCLRVLVRARAVSVELCLRRVARVLVWELEATWDWSVVQARMCRVAMPRSHRPTVEVLPVLRAPLPCARACPRAAAAVAQCPCAAVHRQLGAGALWALLWVKARLAPAARCVFRAV